jgi:hypothetical protein
MLSSSSSIKQSNYQYSPPIFLLEQQFLFVYLANTICFFFKSVVRILVLLCILCLPKPIQDGMQEGAEHHIHSL